MKRILITSCSQRKKTNEELLPAIERYDGPSFRLLRKFINQSADDLDVYILSAKYGLISHKTPIPFYDQKLNTNQIQELTELSFSQSYHIFDEDKKNANFFVNLGNLYLQAFEPSLKKISHANSIVFTKGSSGRRLAEMHDWLYGKNSSLRNQQKEIRSKEVFIQGIRLQTSEKEIHAIVQNEITQNGTKDLQNFQSWFVPIDDLKISPKWLISKLTNLPVSKFHSDQARKVLQKLGIRVQRA